MNFGYLFTFYSEHIEELLWFVIIFVLPVVLLIFLIRFILVKLRKGKKLTIELSDYIYKQFERKANQLNETPKKRIETVLNTYFNITHRY